MSASFYKLKDDSWGVRIKEFAGEPNMEVEVTTKAGDTKTVTLAKRVAKFDDAELWSLAPAGTTNVSKTKPAPKPAPAPVNLADEEPF
jgi:hypothetical protein